MIDTPSLSPGSLLPRPALGRCEPATAAAATSLRPRLPHVLAQLQGCGAPERQLRAYDDALHRLGFSTWQRLRVSGDAWRRQVQGLDCAAGDEGWARRYVDGPSGEHDPRLQGLRHGLPRVWTLASLASDAAPGRDAAVLRALLTSLAQRGWRSGLSLALHGPAGDDVVYLACATPAIAHWIDDETVGQLLILALYAEQLPKAPARVCVAREDKGPTEAQRAILACLREGLADKQIADRLGMSVHNVDYHLRALRRRHGVRNRLQLLQAVAAVDAGAPVVSGTAAPVS